jgi:hypothetical protein
MNEEQQGKMLDNVIDALDSIRRFMGRAALPRKELERGCDRAWTVLLREHGGLISDRP